MKYLIRLIQVHETFRKAELYSLARIADVDFEIIEYNEDSPFCLVDLPSEEAARVFIKRSILSSGIYELWGAGVDDASLRENVKCNPSIQPKKFRDSSFRFSVDGYRGKRDPAANATLIESFSFLPFEGPIKMIGAELDMCIFEDYNPRARTPKVMYLGRFIGRGDRDSVAQFNLKKRNYISRTSMDAELSLVTANLTLAAPGKILYDPFVGTGGFAVACAHYGALTLGSDIDGRSVRGDEDRHLFSNFVQYHLQSYFMDSFIADLTNTPLREGQWLDGILCDPPYGIREGPKVLGYREGKKAELVIIDGQPAHYREGFVHPKRPYGFDDILQDVLDFAFVVLVDHGRLSMWMPTANEDKELGIPSHPGLRLLSNCVQAFNRWSRRLLTYERLPGHNIETNDLTVERIRQSGVTADQLNRFRRKYFGGFREDQKAS